MGTPTSRVTDVGVGICLCHGVPVPTIGMLITGAVSVEKEIFASSRVTDILIHVCGHPSIMVTGAWNVEDEAFASSRIGDVYVGCVIGVLITGAATVSDF